MNCETSLSSNVVKPWTESIHVLHCTPSHVELVSEAFNVGAMWPKFLRTSIMVLKMGTKKTPRATILTIGIIEIMTHYQDRVVKSM